MKLRFYRQKDSMQCGIASLAMVCSCFGSDINPSMIEEICHATREGVSMKAIADASKLLGLESKSLRMPLDSIINVPLPAILHWKQNHFVVLYKISKSLFGGELRFHIADPAKGKITYSEHDFASYWLSTCSGDVEKGVALIFQPGLGFSKRNIKDYQEGKRSLKFLFGYINKYKRYFFQILSGLLLGCVLQLILPFLTQAIVDIGIKNKNINFIWLVLLGEFMIVLGKTATDFVRRWLMLHISMRVNISLLSDFFIKLLQLPMSFFDTKLMGDLLQRMSDHKRVQSFLTNQILSIVFSTLSFMIFGLVLFIYDRFIFLVFFIGSILYAFWISSFLKKRKILDYELFEQQAKNQNKTYQFITSIQEIKLQDCENRRRWEWEDTQANLFDVQMKSLKLQQTQEAGSIFINEVKNIVITVFAATAVIRGSLSLGEMLAVQYIIGQLNSPISQFMNFIYSFQDVKISLERINEIHEGKNEENKDRSVSALKSEKSITFENVDFKYDFHSTDKTIDNVSFSIPEGKVTAIVGASGSGKTTLMKLILGFYPVHSGIIRISGENIDSINLKWWRRQCGAVMQDGVIFSESIARNIAIGDGNIDIKNLEEAARIANIHDFIMSLPLKYNTIIGKDGIGLSQGQKQRILIARAVYKKPDFLFLDEATNSLDAKNERAIVENLSLFFKKRTVVIIAHRLSTVKNADFIIVLDKGKIVEKGTHEYLTASKGFYYSLVKNQLELGT